MAPSNHVHSPSWSSPSPPTIAHSMAPYDGTQRGTTSIAPCNGTLVPRPIRQSGSSPSPPIGSKNPYSYRYLGKKPGIFGILIRFFFGGCQKNVLHDSAANCRTLSASTVVEPWRPPCTPGLFCCRWWELGMVQQATR